MRKAIFFFSFFFVLNECLAQYIVTKVVGNVKKLSGEQVKIGSVLSENETLMFSANSDMVRAIVAGKGTFIIAPNREAKENKNQLVEVLKYTMHVKSKEGYLSGRGENTEFIPDIFETDARVNKKNLICNNSKFLFLRKSFDISNGSKFFIQINYEGEAPVVHPLKTNADTLLLDAGDFTTGVSDINKKVKYALGFFSRQKGSSELIADIDPYFDLTGEMETIVGIIISQNIGTDKSVLQKQCYAEVYDALGKPSDIDFKNVFDKLIAEQKK